MQRFLGSHVPLRGAMTVISSPGGGVACAGLDWKQLRSRSLRAPCRFEISFDYAVFESTPGQYSMCNNAFRRQEPVVPGDVRYLLPHFGTCVQGKRTLQFGTIRALEVDFL